MRIAWARHDEDADPDLREAERFCAVMARREAKNFYWGFLALPHSKRMAIYALYDFARQVDDEADVPQLGGGRAGLERQRQRLGACLAGRPPDPVTLVLGRAVERYRIPASELEALIEGVEMDLGGRRYQTWGELEKYCSLVAGVVGRMCVRIFGFRDPLALDLGERLGVAMQLTNILRDVGEDAAMGRLYLPLRELAEHGIREADLLAGKPGPGWPGLVTFQVDRARSLFAAGLPVCELIPTSCSACVRTMAGIYRRILEEIESDPQRPLRERVSLSGGQKLKVALGSWLAAL